MRKLFRVAITTGDIDGIGSEVTAKALARLRPQRNVQFYLWRSPKTNQKDLKRIDRYFRRVQVTSWPEALAATPDFGKTIIDIESPLPPSRWVETSAKGAFSGSIDALVTAPLSKTSIIKSGMRDNGHTDILKRVTKTKQVFMSFLGKEMNVTLMTGHTSLKKAYDKIDEDLLRTCIEQSMSLTTKLSAKFKKKPLAVVGLNPHAGEEGVIDKKEDDVYKPVIKKFRQKKWAVVGPLVPDVCFQDQERKKYSCYVASYHDQGLIPFKMLHGAHSGIQYSLGLPFIRTSVNHGTAKDIFGKNKADSGSMERAIEIAIKMLNGKNVVW